MEIKEEARQSALRCLERIRMYLESNGPVELIQDEVGMLCRLCGILPAKQDDGETDWTMN